ncbi:hypothetical protein N7474_005848 [Penicillium riverlandense]|uniref:uncharacterized protein n=1 Tax=Penicillium riverlandense TaxID=1903569 RepID=UPI0025493A64|nr:uncharacterized protein N7474_005848 [Penicillium riverlandense]KAJ5820257.1 hypothetical protein N7474_005848 [Penicillium riverlandense]
MDHRSFLQASTLSQKNISILLVDHTENPALGVRTVSGKDLRCFKKDIVCEYKFENGSFRQATHVVRQFINDRPELVSPDSSAYSMFLLLIANKLDELLCPPTAQSVKRTKQLPPSSANRNLVALRYFCHATEAKSNADSDMRAMMSKLTELAFECPYLMHAVIGAATTHLCRVVPNNSSYRVAEAYHWQKSIELYSKDLEIVAEHNMDKLYSTCFILTIRSFMQESFNPRESFIFSKDPVKLNWLLVQGGLRHLLERTSHWLPQSLWYTTFMNARDPWIKYDDDRPGRVDLNPDLADLCGIESTTTLESNPYLWPLRLLSNLLPLERGTNNFRQYCNFMTRLNLGFLERLLEKDPPALIILAWWLALMDSADVWWVETRVRSECIAICMWLEESNNSLVLRLLEFPARQCGYSLRHVNLIGA